MTQEERFQAVFSALKTILQPYAAYLTTEADLPDNFSLNGPFVPKYQKELWFGAVQQRKNYVSYHLMPVYLHPELLKDISPALRRRMQGKSCFNFTRLDPLLFDELAELTARGYALFQQEAS